MTTDLHRLTRPQRCFKELTRHRLASPARHLVVELGRASGKFDLISFADGSSIFVVSYSKARAYAYRFYRVDVEPLSGYNVKF